MNLLLNVSFAGKLNEAVKCFILQSESLEKAVYKGLFLIRSLHSTITIMDFFSIMKFIFQYRLRNYYVR